jgi:hypothetical protein
MSIPGGVQNRYVTAVLYGLAVASGCFLIERYALNLSVDTSLVVAAFLGAAVGTFMAQRRE